MCKHTNEHVAFDKPLIKQNMIMKTIAESHMEINQTHLLTYKTTDLMDTINNKLTHKEISMIKVMTPRITNQIIDRTIQIHGNANVTEDFHLTHNYATTHILRIVDGPNKMHTISIAKIELKNQAQNQKQKK